MTTKGYWQNWYGQIKTWDKVLVKITPECPYPSFFEEGSILLATVTWVCGDIYIEASANKPNRAGPFCFKISNPIGRDFYYAKDNIPILCKAYSETSKIAIDWRKENMK